MCRRYIHTLFIGFAFFAVGYLFPHSILLDLPFGLAVYVVELLGYWSPSPMWVEEHGLLSGFCYVVYPLLLSMLLGYATAAVTCRLWGTGDEQSRLRTLIFLIALFGFILLIRAEPGTLHISNYAHWTMHY